MIQRKQSIYLLATVILTIVCLCLPIANIELSGMGIGPVLFNLGLKDSTGNFDFGQCPLFILLTLTCPISIATIFMYKNRKIQAKLCLLSICFYTLWYAYLAFCWLTQLNELGSVHPSVSASLPLISIILCFMARKGINDDEKLVRAADRIR